jgi:hypothetical protein
MTIHGWLKSQEFEVNTGKTTQTGKKCDSSENEVEAKEGMAEPTRRGLIQAAKRGSYIPGRRD